MSIDPPGSEADQAAATNSPAAAKETLAFARPVTASVAIDPLDAGVHEPQASSNAPAKECLATRCARFVMLGTMNQA